MNPTDELTQALSAMLAHAAPTREPDGLFGVVMDATGGVSQRPRLLARAALATPGAASHPASRMALIGVGALLMLALALGLALVAGSRPAPPDPRGEYHYTGFGMAWGTPFRFSPGSGTAVVLADGRVLVVECDREAAYLIDGDTDAGGSTGAPVDPCRSFAATALLQDGRVLIAGSGLQDESSASAELYDPSTGTFTPTGSMLAGRYGMRATTLADGHVLVTGGALSGPSGGFALDTAELYDPVTGTFGATGRMTRARETHEAVLLVDGRVLLVGGTVGDEGVIDGTLEVFDPDTGTLAVVGTMLTPRTGVTATLLRDGRVLLAGGRAIVAGNDQVSDAAEIFDPRTNTLTATGSLLQPRFMHGAAPPADGRVLVVGGDHTWGIGGNRALAPVADTEIYDPATGRFTVADSMSKARLRPLVLRLAGPEVMVLGARPASQASADETTSYEVFR
jgi:hypothetical protein